MATPLNMPTRRTVKSVRMTMAARHARCQDGANCTGPGCRVATGKTSRTGIYTPDTRS